MLRYDTEALQTELARRVLEAQHVLYPDAAAWYEERVGEAEKVPGQRALPLRLVNDLQWAVLLATASGFPGPPSRQA